jgi:hypothetical protein
VFALAITLIRNVECAHKSQSLAVHLLFALAAVHTTMSRQGNNQRRHGERAHLPVNQGNANRRLAEAGNLNVADIAAHNNNNNNNNFVPS